MTGVAPAPKSAHRAAWTLDPAITYLTHGTFGACPSVVLDAQAALRAELEREPVEFFMRRLEGRLDEARAELGALLGAAPDDLVFVPNATTGVNAVLRSLELGPGDELLTTDHEYNACRNALEYVASRSGARVVVAPVPFPIDDAGHVVEAVLARVTPRTRLALLDHVTSPTALVLPLAALARELEARGVEVLVDGAHAPGMVDLDLASLGVTFYTGNCHKWLCAPKGAAFLWVRRDRQATVRPAVISHGANSPRDDRSRFRLEFDWTGTTDPTAILCVPAALRFMGALLPGGWPALRADNHGKALAGRRVLCDALGVPPPCPDAMIGAMAAVPLPDAPACRPGTPLDLDPLHDALFDRYRIEVPIVPWPAAPRRLVRISAQIYNAPGEYEALGRALREVLAGGG